MGKTTAKPRANTAGCCEICPISDNPSHVSSKLVEIRSKFDGTAPVWDEINDEFDERDPIRDIHTSAIHECLETKFYGKCALSKEIM